MSFGEILKSEVLISVGSGGVGKTTISSAIAYRAAREGKKVLVYTIDPSKRLASCLGLSHWRGQEVMVKRFDSGGELWAAMIESKKVFDNFVFEYSRSEMEAKALIESRLYHELSTSLSGSQEFTSLYALKNAFKGGKYDHIVLDTPPAQHTIDFVRAPEMIYGLFSGPIVNWFVNIEKQKKGLNLLFNKGAKVALHVLESLAGGEFLSELQIFFSMVASLQGAIQETAIETQKLLMSDSTQFLTVTNPESSKLLEAKEVIREFKLRGFRMNHMIINRVLPDFQNIEMMSEDGRKIKKMHDEFKSFYKDQQQRVFGQGSAETKGLLVWTVEQIMQQSDELASLGQISERIQIQNKN